MSNDTDITPDFYRIEVPEDVFYVQVRAGRGVSGLYVWGLSVYDGDGDGPTAEYRTLGKPLDQILAIWPRSLWHFDRDRRGEAQDKYDARHPAVDLPTFAVEALAKLDEIQATLECIVKQRDEARRERDALANRQVVVVCAEHGDVLAATWEDDDGDLLVTVEPCSRCTDDAFGAGHARATWRNQ